MKTLLRWSLLCLLPVVAFCAVPRHLESHVGKHDLHPRSTTCVDGFQANGDFYGLGIRLGVYFQWVASWISNTFSPEDAAGTHDANSIFVLAMATALAVSFRTSELRPAEAYIMFSICFGFYFTVLSIFGFRIHFLQPRSVREFAHGFLKADMGRQAVKQNVKRIKSVRNLATALQMCRGFLTPFKISFTSAAFGKHYSLSWTGIVWRSGIASLVCSLNIYFWFYALDNQASSDLDDCGNEVFLFAPFRLDSAARIAFKILAVLLSIMPYYVMYVTYVLSFQVFGSLLGYSGIKIKIDDHAVPNAGSGVPVPKQSRTQRWLNAMIALLVRDEKVHENREKIIAADGEVTDLTSTELSKPRTFDAREKKASIIYCALAHVLIGATILCLIVFIEETITLNGIQGAYIIKSTGQLIPFIIGVASLLATIKDIALDWLHEKYPNPENVHFSYAGLIATDFESPADHRDRESFIREQPTGPHETEALDKVEWNSRMVDSRHE